MPHWFRFSVTLGSIFLITLCLPLLGHAQPLCYSTYNYYYGVRYTCTNTLVINASTPCTGCSYTWSGSPTAGQGTPTATYQWPGPLSGWGHTVSYLDLDVYRPSPGCIYGELYDVSFAAKPNIALPALQNGPWNGDTSKTWIYARSYLNPAPQVSGTMSFWPSWTVNGGTVIRNAHVLSGPYYYDSVYVKWTGPAPMLLNEFQTTTHSPPILVTYSCNWTTTPTQMAYPSLSIFYNGLICSGSNKNFFTFPFANSSYTWSVTNGSVVSGQGTNSAQIQVNGPATITVVRDSSGTITSTNISVNPTMSVINLGPDQTVCAGTPVILNAGSGFSQYTWSTGATTQSITVNSPGTYHVSANINGGCVANDTIQISHLPVTATNLGPDVHACAFPVTLDAGPGFTGYNWSTGATTQTISVGTAGSYRVTVTNANGCTDADTVLVYNNQTTVNLPPTQTFCQPGSLTLTPSYTNAGIYLWSTGATTPSISVTSPGTYWIQASNIYGCQASDTVIVTGLPRPTPSLGPDPTVCPGTPVTFNAGGGYISYLWSTFATTPSITVSNLGTYRVTVTASNGCTGSDTVVLNNHPFIPPNLGPDINVCQASATLNPGNTYSSYLWNTGATTPTITVNSSGTYSVTVTDVNGCTGSDDINVAFNNLSMTLGPNVTVCQPQTVTLDPQLTGVLTYNWSTGATTPTLTLSNPGTYNVTLTVSNSYGCTAVSAVSVVILPTPPSLIGNDTILCADTSITLNMGPGFSSYAWSTGATTQSITVPVGGVYTVSATAANGCIRLDTALISDLIDCVFPGDVNYDQGVDLLDVLSLGPVMGFTGPVRANASTNWYGQQCTNWTGSVTSGANAKHADTDGNGTITQGDTAAIQLNFGSTHTRIGGITGGPGQIRVVPVNPTVQAGDIAQFAVFYEGGLGTDIDSVHGLALHLTWPSTGLMGPGLVSVDYSSSWFAPGSNHLDFTRRSSNSAHLAITRTSGGDTSGQGLVMILSFQTDSSLAPGHSVGVTPQVVLAMVTDSSLHVVTPLVSVGTLVVAGAVSVGPQIRTHVVVMPIPADDQINVKVDGLVADGRIQLLNMLGQVLVDVPVIQDVWQVLPTSDVPAGNYGVRVQTSQGTYFKKVAVQH